MDSYSTPLIKAWLKSKGKTDLDAYRIVKDLKNFAHKSPPPEPEFSREDCKPVYDKNINWKNKTPKELMELERKLTK